MTKSSIIRIAVASVATVTVIAAAFIGSADSEPPSAHIADTPTSVNPTPMIGESAPTDPTRSTDADSAKPFASDARGFLDGTARCAPEQAVAAIGHTAKSLVVICKSADGRLEYKGTRLSLGAGVSVGDVSAADGGFVARNAAMTYAVTPTELIIRSADAVVAREPMVEYRGPLAVPPPAVPPPAASAPARPAPPVQRPANPAGQNTTAPRVPLPPPAAAPSSGYPLLPVTVRDTGNGVVRFTAVRPWQLRYRIFCPPDAAVRGTIDAGASYMRYHVELRGDPNAIVEGISPTRDQPGPIAVAIALSDQRCGWEVSI